MHTYIHAYIHTLHAYMHTCIHTYTHTYTYIHTRDTLRAQRLNGHSLDMAQANSRHTLRTNFRNHEPIKLYVNRIVEFKTRTYHRRSGRGTAGRRGEADQHDTPTEQKQIIIIIIIIIIVYTTYIYIYR